MTINVLDDSLQPLVIAFRDLDEFTLRIHESPLVQSVPGPDPASAESWGKIRIHPREINPRFRRFRSFRLFRHEIPRVRYEDSSIFGDVSVVEEGEHSSVDVQDLSLSPLARSSGAGNLFHGVVSSQFVTVVICGDRSSGVLLDTDLVRSQVSDMAELVEDTEDVSLDLEDDTGGLLAARSNEEQSAKRWSSQTLRKDILKLDQIVQLKLSDVVHTTADFGGLSDVLREHLHFPHTQIAQESDLVIPHSNHHTRLIRISSSHDLDVFSDLEVLPDALRRNLNPRTRKIGEEILERRDEDGICSRSSGRGGRMYDGIDRSRDPSLVTFENDDVVTGLEDHL